MPESAVFAFSVPQVAARWGVSTRMVYDLCGSGRRGAQAKSAPGEPEALIWRGEKCRVSSGCGQNPLHEQTGRARR